MSIQKNIEGIFKNWKQSLTSEEKNILCEYSKFLYEDVNLFLRDDILNSNDFGNSPDDFKIKENIDIIDNILNRFILDEEILVYRNEHHSISLEEMHEFLCGVDRIEYRNFVSTSFTKEASEQFLSILKNQYQNDIFLCIEGNINKGVPCGYLDKDISVMLGEEDEILMSRNIIFKIKQNSIIINNIDKTINIYGEFTKE
ncbi:ADP-ribosyltransferase [Fusobacterium sp. SYSU M8D902]|uniref:ADP-ribosyltransferase n=1 Tax=Fusobacterium sp. SYSU M8D902 TaxID=3159562 RepID=UPI0032E4436D